MEVAVLQLFIDVMRKGTFAAAAREHDLDPSSVSRAISGLEEELGVRLFQRTTRKLSPTEAGINYFQKIEPLVQELGQAMEVVTDATGKPSGTVRVSSSVSFGLTCIVPHLSEFQKEYPDLTVDLQLSDAVVDIVAERFDLAIRLGRPADSTLIARKLMSTRYHVVASKKYRKSAPPLSCPKDLKEHNCLLFPLSSYRTRWRFRDAKKRVTEVPIGGKTVISSATALRECALQGMGVALLPHWIVEDDLKKGTLVDLFPQLQPTATDFETAAWLVYPSRQYVPLKLRVFIDWLKTRVERALQEE